MATGREKLSDDLRILEEMAAKMGEYLNSENLFWQAHKEGVPEPTIGQFLLRQHRLQALSNTLSDEEQRRLAAAIQQFNQAVTGKSVSLKQKAQQEFKTRLRLWSEALKELLEDDSPSMAYYRTEAENRVILELLKTQSVGLEPDLVEQLSTLDRKLRQRWEPGPFIWPAEWQPAYPHSQYWWLYGELS
jgi:hypothetical protein